MKILIVIAILAYFAWSYFKPAEVVHLKPGVEAYSEPTQYTVAYAEPFTYKEHTLTPVAEFEIQAKVLRQEPYYLDRASDISPVDFVLGWRSMSDQEIVDQFEFRQNLRWYSWHSETARMRNYEIIGQTANTHLIPANDEVREKIKQVKTGDIIHLVGQLVNVQGQDGWFWKTSISRHDKGDYSSEIIWVQDLDIVKTLDLDKLEETDTL